MTRDPVLEFIDRERRRQKLRRRDMAVLTGVPYGTVNNHWARRSDPHLGTVRRYLAALGYQILIVPVDVLDRPENRQISPPGPVVG